MEQAEQAAEGQSETKSTGKQAITTEDKPVVERQSSKRLVESQKSDSNLQPAENATKPEEKPLQTQPSAKTIVPIEEAPASEPKSELADL